MTRVILEGRKFDVGYTRVGILRINERRRANPGHPYLETYYDVTVYHAGKGRKPNRKQRQILALAKGKMHVEG